MLDFSPEKMFFIFLIVLMVLGPEKLPEVSRKFGRAMGELRKLSGGFREEMNRAVTDMTNDSGGTSRPAPSEPGITEISPTRSPSTSTDESTGT
ncbi:MAG: twin-arginine translocase TatA/TatE family subunit [Actinobacteria bacterium]|nr:twin-arginine translocase TatA/TatE family subunit [Actinomycetota bacterium]